MNGYLNRSHAVLEECARYIDSSKATGSAIEFYLTQHLLVLLVADVEAALHVQIEKRAGTSGDKKVASYCSAAAKKTIRSIKKADLADLLATFDESCRIAFNDKLDDRITTAYGNAVIARHKIAHSSGAQMTLVDFREALAATEKILDAFEESLA